MKKVGIVTLYGNANYGNKLQNYAVQEILKDFNLDPITIKNIPELNIKKMYVVRYIRFIVKYIFHRLILRDEKYTDNEYNYDMNRTNNFKKFDEYIKTSKSYFNYFNAHKYSKFDYYCVGSDQIWNPNYGCLNEFDLLGFVKHGTKFSLAASFGVDEISDYYKAKSKPFLEKFSGISVREEEGCKILKSFVNSNINVLIDPTMMLSSDKWQKLEKKPDNMTNKKYILTYFLGNISDDKMSYIKKIAKDNNCEIINILDKDSNYYKCGPSEFLWLEHNAFMVMTDSFHSCVFSILFEKPFIVFDRDDNLKKMNSRIDTLLNKFKLTDRKFNPDKRDYLNCNFDLCYSILNKERKKVIDYLNNIIKE